MSDQINEPMKAPGAQPTGPGTGGPGEGEHVAKLDGDLGSFFALPPFKADEALVKLRRDLREFKALAEKGTGDVVRFEWKGLPVIELSLAPAPDGAKPAPKPAMMLALAKKPSQRPDWARHTLTSSAEVRKLLDEVKRSLKRWDDED